MIPVSSILSTTNRNTTVTEVQSDAPEIEGVIKYHLDYRPAPASPLVGFADLNAWRSLLWRLGLIGQDPARYGGLGYGNVSVRSSPGYFGITGTQTGHLPHLTAQHYVQVLRAEPDENYLQAEGPIAPSSEALTHAAVYAASSRVDCVVHVHSPEIWQRVGALALPCVPAHIAYGTPAMAEQVGALVRRQPDQGVIAMLGHEDGLISYGATPEQACWLLVRALAESYAKERP
ncbi:MAG: class II aldolase/adducin family protein [Methylococcaceae bacterium]|nr:MAG: class II aldolase/adducin family protein [Methylococcaceae bacterium]